MQAGTTLGAVTWAHYSLHCDVCDLRMRGVVWSCVCVCVGARGYLGTYHHSKFEVRDGQLQREAGEAGSMAV